MAPSGSNEKTTDSDDRNCVDELTWISLSKSYNRLAGSYNISSIQPDRSLEGSCSVDLKYLLPLEETLHII